MKLLGIISVGIEVRDRLLIRLISFVTCWKKGAYNGTVHQLFIDFTKAYYLFRREVLYNILIESAEPRKLVTLIKMR
jgi:hypothetical protein